LPACRRPSFPSLVPETLNHTCHTNNLAAKSYLAFRTAPIEELTKLAEVIHKEFSDYIFFTCRPILTYDT
jgi:hypothetical protein